MNRGTRMAGMRLGLTYAAAIVLLGLLVAMVAAPVSSQTREQPPGSKGFIGIKLQRAGSADTRKSPRQGRFGFTAVPGRTRAAAPSTGRAPAPANRNRRSD